MISRHNQTASRTIRVLFALEKRGLLLSCTLSGRKVVPRQSEPCGFRCVTSAVHFFVMGGKNDETNSQRASCVVYALRPAAHGLVGGTGIFGDRRRLQAQKILSMM